MDIDKINNLVESIQKKPKGDKKVVQEQIDLNPDFLKEINDLLKKVDPTLAEDVFFGKDKKKIAG